jgi:hypothetical protein
MLILTRPTAIRTEVICDFIQRLRNAFWQIPSYMSPGPVCPKSLPTNHPRTSAHLRPRSYYLYSKYRHQTTNLKLN